MPVICVASHHARLRDLLNDREFERLRNRAGFLVELRLDQYTDMSAGTLQEAMNNFAPACVATCRHPEEGGKLTHFSDAERVHFLCRAAESGAQYVDIEGRTPAPDFVKCGAKVIRSYHDFEKVPPPGFLKAKWDELAAQGADVVKIAVMPRTIHDTLPLLDVYAHAQKCGVPTLLLAMGEAGLWTRVLAGKLGAPFTFARASGAPGTAPGQPVWSELSELYNYANIARETPVYAVIGNPVAHSLSPLMHNSALRAAQLPGVYLPLKVEGDPLPVLRAFERLELRGVSVTIPHKEALSALCSEIDPVATKIGAINTLLLRKSSAEGTPPQSPGGWFATNTDAPAAAGSLAAMAGDLRGKRIAILGAGGAARAVAFGVKELGAEIFVLNRTRARAEALANDCGGRAIDVTELAALKIDIVVNTTSLGMHPNVDSSPLEKDQIPQGGVVFDTVYNPLRTKLLNMAEERGCRVLDGLEMFVGQGVRQFELFTGAKAPQGIMRETVAKELAARQSRQ
jgi:3-dehydroquinate dehydratase / shikimate dehydrogenase